METALITGASSGIGWELAQLFAQNKIHLVIIARSEDKLIELKNNLEKQYGIHVKVIAQDLSKQGSAEVVFNEVASSNITINYLVNNAGFGDYSLFKDANKIKLHEMMYLNMVTLTELTHYFLPQLLNQEKAKILNVGSIASFMPGPYMAVYYATKNYVLAFGNALDEELKNTQVSVTTLCPGLTRTGFIDKAEMNNSKAKMLGQATSKEVAEYGFNKMMKNKRIAIHGFMNKGLILFSKLIPSKLKTLIVKTISEPR